VLRNGAIRVPNPLETSGTAFALGWDVGGTIHILPGRHQPPHFDHVAIIRRALSMFDGPLVVALVTHHPTTESIRHPLVEEGDAHHRPERTPFSYLERKQMLDAAFEELLSCEERERVELLPLPRPELSWAYVESVFAEERVWIVPDVGERFDDEKAEFFRSKGDRVVRVPLKPTVSGYSVRQRIERSEPLEGLVPRAVARFIENWRKQ